MVLSPPIAPFRQECSSLPSDYCQWPGGCRRRSVSVALLQQLLPFLCSAPDLPTVGAGSCHPPQIENVCIVRGTICTYTFSTGEGRKDDRRGGCAAAANNDSSSSLFVRSIVLYQYLNPEGESILLIPPSPFSGLFYSVRSISPLWRRCH